MICIATCFKESLAEIKYVLITPCFLNICGKRKGTCGTCGPGRGRVFVALILALTWMLFIYLYLLLKFFLT